MSDSVRQGRLVFQYRFHTELTRSCKFRFACVQFVPDRTVGFISVTTVNGDLVTERNRSCTLQFNTSLHFGTTGADDPNRPPPPFPDRVSMELRDHQRNRVGSRLRGTGRTRKILVYTTRHGRFTPLVLSRTDKIRTKVLTIPPIHTERERTNTMKISSKL